MAYVLALSHLLTHPGDAAGAAAAAEGWANQHAAPEVQRWLNTAKQPGPGPLVVYKQAGFLKWAFIHAFRWGRQGGGGGGGPACLLLVVTLFVLHCPFTDGCADSGWPLLTWQGAAPDAGF